MSIDSYAARKQISFAQAEGVEPLPQQLKLKEVSKQLCAELWSIIHLSLMQERAVIHGHWGFEPNGLWLTVLYRKHVERDHLMSDEFTNDFNFLVGQLKRIFTSQNYVTVFDFLTWLLEQPENQIPANRVRQALEASRAAYRLLEDDRTFFPISSEAELTTINCALVNLAATEFDGARAHLQAAAKHLTMGKSADSVRESMHAVESVARVLGGTNSLAGALKELKLKRMLHPALEEGFKKIYGYTSDEQGIRHPLLDDGTAHVDEFDAMFMIGACAAFVSYLINRSITIA
jgi:hypothetical protein